LPSGSAHAKLRRGFIVGTPLHLRVFLSSPGDVADERVLAMEIVERVPRKPMLRGKVTLELVAWDDPLAQTPLCAGESPQESVNAYNTPPGICDVTVLILWSRLGTPLAGHIHKPDGKRYASGTEWEFENAREAAKKILIYQREQKPKIDIDDPEQQKKSDQYRALKAFFATLNASDGSLAGGVNAYLNLADFGALFEQHLEAEIRRRLEQAERDERGSGRPHAAKDGRFKVFIASAADDMRTSRMRLVNELRQKPDLEVLDEVPPPLERDPHAAAVLESMTRADLCVHLLGAQAGFPVEWDEPGWSYPLEQARIGLGNARSQLFLHPQTFDAARVESAAYQALLAAINQHELPRLRLELVKCSTPQMLELILAKQRQIKEERQRLALRAAATTAFVDVHVKDSPFAHDLFDFLPRENVTPLTIPRSDAATATPSALTSRFAENLRRSQMFIVVFGTVARHWVDERLAEAFKLILNERLSTKLGVYVVPPSKDQAQVSFPVPVMNSSTQFDESSLRHFLGQAAGAA